MEAGLVQAVAKIWVRSHGHKYSGRADWVLSAAISRRGWDSKAEFIGDYSFVELPQGIGEWRGNVTLLDPPKVGATVRIDTPFGELHPISSLGSRVIGMPKIKRVVEG